MASIIQILHRKYMTKSNFIYQKREKCPHSMLIFSRKHEKLTCCARARASWTAALLATAPEDITCQGQLVKNKLPMRLSWSKRSVVPTKAGVDYAALPGKRLIYGNEQRKRKSERLGTRRRSYVNMCRTAETPRLGCVSGVGGEVSRWNGIRKDS